MDGVDPTAVTVAPGEEPFTVFPVIQDLVRTRFCVPGSIFLVEDVQVIPLTQTGRWQVVRLLLGDGELCIQAILGDAMHNFVHTGEVAVGNYVRLQDFQLRLRNLKADDDAGGEESKQMVYLVVNDMLSVGWNDSIRAMIAPDGRGDAELTDAELQDDMRSPRQIKGKSPIRPSSRISSVTSTPTKPSRLRSSQTHRDREDPQPDDDDDMEDAFEEFEALTFPVKKKTPSQTQPGEQESQTITSKSTRQTAPKQALPIALPKDWHDLQAPLKLTTLRAIPNLPYAQNWTCNVLAIIASISPVEASNLPPYKQRTARLTDPSTAKQVHLTVFLDPEEFIPPVGAAVLLTGVKNHRFDGGSLKKYASDKGTGIPGSIGTKWWFRDPWELGWCDVKGIKDWWAEMEAYFASSGGAGL